MPQRKVVIASKSGLHARPASIFTQAVAACGEDVTIAKPGGAPVDASSILMVMAMGAENGDEVVLEADGPEADRVLEELVALLARDLDAE